MSANHGAWRSPADRVYAATADLRAALKRADRGEAEATARQVIPLAVRHAERLNARSMLPARAARRRMAYRDRLAKAQTPAERVHAATEYLRAALKQAGRREAEATAREVIPLAVRHAERLNGRAGHEE